MSIAFSSTLAFASATGIKKFFLLLVSAKERGSHNPCWFFFHLFHRQLLLRQSWIYGWDANKHDDDECCTCCKWNAATSETSPRSNNSVRIFISRGFSSFDRHEKKTLSTLLHMVVNYHLRLSKEGRFSLHLEVEVQENPVV
jgi:hypothetical protein